MEDYRKIFGWTNPEVSIKIGVMEWKLDPGLFSRFFEG